MARVGVLTVSSSAGVVTVVVSVAVSAVAVVARARGAVRAAAVRDSPMSRRRKGFTRAPLVLGSGHDNGASAPVLIACVRCDPLTRGLGEDGGCERRGTPRT